jgi:hypothetical protein
MLISLVYVHIGTNADCNGPVHPDTFQTKIWQPR